MFIGLIEFNKLVSLKGFTRLVKGKRIRVKAHNRRVKVSGIYVTDKEVLLTSNNSLTGKRGLDGRIPFSKSFKTGTAPLELDNFASDQKLDKYGLSDGWFKGNHPGNSITEVEYK